MTTASKFTLARVVMIPAFMLAFLLSPGTPWLKWVDFGKFLDPLADKLLVISAMCILCQWQQFPAWAFMVVLAREFAVTGLRLIAVTTGRVIAAGWSGKVKTFSTMVVLCLWIVTWDLGAISWLKWIYTLVIVLPTLYSGVEYFIQNWDCLGLKK